MFNFMAKSIQINTARRPKPNAIIRSISFIANILIGTLAVEYGGLITRNSKDFSSLYPDLEIIVP